MTRIQDVRDLIEEICAKVEEYLQEKECYEAPVLIIGHEDCDFVIDFDEPDKVKRTDDCEQYPMDDLTRFNEDGIEEPDYDSISRIANTWVFIEH